MRQRLKLVNIALPPELALSELREVQRHWARIKQGEPITGGPSN